MSVEFLDCLKRERDISIKAMSSGGKMAFRLIPSLTWASGEMVWPMEQKISGISKKFPGNGQQVVHIFDSVPQI